MSPAPLLIVEDNEDDLFLLTRAFERAHVANPVQSVRSGAELTKYLMGIGPFRDTQTASAAGIDFSVTLRLRDMQGTDVLRFLTGQKDLTGVTVIVWTTQIGPSRRGGSAGSWASSVAWPNRTIWNR